MERVDGVMSDVLSANQMHEATLENILYACVKLIKDLHAADLCHGDMHWNNIGYRVNMNARRNFIEFVLIDCGVARRGADPEAEMVQLIRTCHESFGILRNAYNREWLRTRLEIIYRNNFTRRVKYSLHYWNKRYACIEAEAF